MENQAEGDLDRFKAFIESERYATGAWRGSVNEGADAGTPTADDAASSRGDSGKAGVSGAAVAAGAGVAAAVVGGAVAASRAGKKGADGDRYEAAETDTGLDVGTPLAAMPETPVVASTGEPDVVSPAVSGVPTSQYDDREAEDELGLPRRDTDER